EELQSTNEELETSQEELQSLNEELVTVNSELQGKIEDVTRANDDMKNLLDSTKIATIFLDNELRVKRFTAEATKIINLIQADVGRPVSDIVSSLEGNTLARDAQQVIESLVTKEAPVKAKNGRWYLSRIIPYRTVENMIDGVVMTFTDITDQEIAQSMIQDARNLAEGMVETVREPLVALDGNFEVMAANAAFCSLFGTSPEVTVGQNFFDLGNGQWNIPKLRELLENVLPHNRRIDNFTVDHDFPTIGHKQIAVNAVRIHREGIGTEAILLGFEDITAERKER
ncbi:MAG: PAS domain-containing protein, partial [Alphaproteobacteria bacterium]